METSGNKPLVKRGSEKEVTSQKGRYKSKCYGRRKESNSFKTLIGKKRKEEVDIGDDIDKVDANTIDEIVVRQPSFGSDACNERFDSDSNKIEAFGSS